MSTGAEPPAEVERLEAKNVVPRVRGSKGVSMKVSEGAVSVCGLRRAPVTLYKEQWLRLLDLAGDIREFIDEHETQLERKEQGKRQADLFEVINDQR